MPTLITETRLRQAIEQQTFLKDGDVGSVEGIKYDFHTGQRILKASFGRPVNICDLSGAEQRELFIAPGEVVFVLTKERLNLPNNVMALLSPKRKMSHLGIIVLGGQAIDPKYRGVLWFGMYNFSSTPFPLEANRKLIAATFYELNEGEAADFPEPEASDFVDFPPELIALVHQYKPTDLRGLQDSLNDTRRELAALKADIASDKTWRDTFKHDLDELKQVVSETSKNVVRLGDNLEKEASLRVQEDKDIQKRVTDMSNMFFGWNLFRLVVVAIVLLILGAALTVLGERMFGDATPAPTTPVTVPAAPHKP